MLSSLLSCYPRTTLPHQTRLIFPRTTLPHQTRLIFPKNCDMHYKCVPRRSLGLLLRDAGADGLRCWPVVVVVNLPSCLLAAAKFALHHIDEGHTLPEVDIDNSSLACEIQSHWTLLHTVLSYLKWCYSIDERSLNELLEQIVLLQVEAFRLLDSPDHTPSVPVHLLDGCMSAILSICERNTIGKVSYPARPIHTTLLHVTMSRLQYNYTQHPMDYVSFRSMLRSADSLMRAALNAGHHEAYCLFAQDKWIQRLGPLWMAGWDWETGPVLYPRLGVQIIDCFVFGLTTPSMAVSRQQFIDHLYEPENLAIAVCVVFPDAEMLRSLTALNPTHSSWDRCRALMESIIAWNRSPDRETTEFPGEYLLASKVVQCSDQSVSLEEHIRRRFMGEEAGEKLDMAMQVLNESLLVEQSSRPQ
ncbi:hypothetical protein BDZ89DRAFT_660607 [Hymenopellis radicata]|nr:hypothetical protein BDZ89DRAFT_660607 [Hymenopellis radicata]